MILNPLHRFSLLILTVLITMASAQPVAAQQDPPLTGIQAHGYYHSPVTPTVEPRTTARQKAQLRAQHRMARLERLRRYGLTPNRPPATAVPFTSAHTLTWMRTGRSPFIYDRSGRPFVYYSSPYTIYR